jgi:anti-sigma regulatory factor (Ser/Thr protein kinase)
MTNLDQTRMPPAFRHEALFYAGEDEFLAHTVPFIAAGVERSEPVLVVVNARKIAALRSALNGAAGEVQFADMAEVGHNPARIIPAWHDFVNKNGGGTKRLRGIGEPISADRSEAALAECHRHESLLNLAFADSGDWWLLCPYDTASLSDEVVEEAHCTHPFVFERGEHRSSPMARDLEAISAPFEDPLPDAPVGTAEFMFDVRGLAAVRVLTRDMGVRAGLAPGRICDLALAIDEVATNSIRHGGGKGVLRIWIEDDAVFCDVRDAGQVDDPLVGRRRPSPEQIGGRGMWLVNQLCELVQIRSSRAGTIVRLHLERH